MPDPIKQQVIARVITVLTPLVTNATFRSLTRENDRLRDSKSLPALMLADGPETIYSKTDTVWTCRFPLEIRIVFAKSRDAGERKDLLVAEVQKTLEADITLAGLGRILNVSPDGRRFLLRVVPADRVPPPIVVVHDWATRLPE